MSSLKADASFGDVHRQTACGVQGESALGHWASDEEGIVRFTPVSLPTLVRYFHGFSSSLDSLAPFCAVVKSQALFVLNRYLCGGLALRSGGAVTWPEVLLAHGCAAQAKRPRPQKTPMSAAQGLFEQQRNFAGALEVLRTRPLTTAVLCSSQMRLCPEIPKAGQGRLRWCDVWAQGTSVRDAKFVPMAAQNVPIAVEGFVADINSAVLARLHEVAEGSSTGSISALASAECLAAQSAARSSADLGLAAHITLLGLHPFTDGNGRVSRSLFQSLARNGERPAEAALFASSFMLVSRVLQPQIWGQALWRAQFGMEGVSVFLSVCRQTASIGLDLCLALLDGLQAAWIASDDVTDLGGWLPGCPLIRVDEAYRPPSPTSRLMSVPLHGARNGRVARDMIEFLMSFELALRDCVEPA